MSDSEPATPVPPVLTSALGERTVFVADEQADVRVEAVEMAALAAHALVSEGVKPEGELSLLFVDEATMGDLHARFLGLEGPTDVLAFPMDEELLESGRQPDQGGRGPGAATEPLDPPTLIGDVVICPAVAARQAGERGVSTGDELKLLVVHGVLHLLEYDHVEDDEAEKMQSRERELLASFGGEAPADTGSHSGSPDR